MTETSPAPAHPSLLDRVKTWFHGEADAHKPLFVEAVEKLHELEGRFAKLEAEVAGLVRKDAPVVEHTAEQVAADAAPVVKDAVADAAKAAGAP